VAQLVREGRIVLRKKTPEEPPAPAPASPPPAPPADRVPQEA
jgi:hypothetical protein